MSEDKRHKASDHKLRQAKKRGEIAYSKDLTGAFGFLCGLVAAWVTDWRVHLEALFDAALKPLPKGEGGDIHVIIGMIGHCVWLALPVLVAAAVGGLVMAMVQARGVFSMDLIEFKFERLNPAEGFKRLFSTRQLIELVKMILKIIVSLGVLMWVVETGVSPLVAGIYASAEDVGVPTLQLLQILFWCVAALLLVFGMIDFAHQYFEFMKQNRMDDAEQQREHRELEGDPHVKAELKSQRKALLQAPITPAKGMKNASVLLTNPTHYSVALYYEAGVVELPVLVAKGEDAEAFQLRREAQRLSIPIMENPPLCRALFQKVGLQQYIGEEHIEPVAEVFRWLQSLKRATDY